MVRHHRLKPMVPRDRLEAGRFVAVKLKYHRLKPVVSGTTYHQIKSLNSFFPQLTQPQLLCDKLSTISLTFIIVAI